MAERYASLKQGLVGAWIPSVSGSGFLLPDLSGRGNNGTLTNMAADDWVSGQYGRALDFDGVNDWVEIKSIRASFGFSFSCWLKASSATATRQSFFANAEVGFSPLYLHVEQVSGTTAAMNFYAFTYLGLSTSFTQDTDWHLYTWIADNSGLVSYYRDGKSLGSAASTWTPASYVDTVATIGSIKQAFNAGFIIGGQIDDCRIYNRALSESEIRILSSEPGIGFKPAKKLSRFSQRYATYNPPKAKTYSVIRVKETDHANLREGLVGAWCPSIAGSGNLLPDVSGYGNHGTLTNMAADDWVSGQYGRALDFVSSTNQYVQVASTANQLTVPNTQVSISAWCRPTANSTSVGREIASKFHNSGPPYISYGLQFSTASISNGFAFAIGTNTIQDSDYILLQANVASALNEFHHICGTYDGQLMKIYINGKQNNTRAETRTMIFAAQPFSIGRWLGNSSTDEAFIGQLDDIRIYNRALSEPEIRLLASRPGIGLRQEQHRQTFYQFPSGSRRRLLLTGQT